MDTQEQIRRLAEQLPGRHIWYSSGSRATRWNAVPAPADTTHTEALYLPGRVSAATPEELLALVQD